MHYATIALLLVTLVGTFTFSNHPRLTALLEAAGFGAAGGAVLGIFANATATFALAALGGALAAGGSAFFRHHSLTHAAAASVPVRRHREVLR